MGSADMRQAYDATPESADDRFPLTGLVDSSQSSVGLKGDSDGHNGLVRSDGELPAEDRTRDST